MKFLLCSFSSHKLLNNPRKIANYRTHLQNLELASSSKDSTQTLMHENSQRWRWFKLRSLWESHYATIFMLVLPLIIGLCRSSDLSEEGRVVRNLEREERVFRILPCRERSAQEMSYQIKHWETFKRDITPIA